MAHPAPNPAAQGVQPSDPSGPTFHADAVLTHESDERAAATLNSVRLAHGVTSLPHTTMFAVGLRHSIDEVAFRKSLMELVSRHGVLLPAYHQVVCGTTSPLRAKGSRTPRSACTCVNAAVDYQAECATAGERLSTSTTRPWLEKLVAEEWPTPPPLSSAGGVRGKGSVTLRVRLLSAQGRESPAHATAQDALAHVLVVLAPRALVDPPSMAILFQDLSQLYKSAHFDASVTLPHLEMDFLDYRHWQDEVIAVRTGLVTLLSVATAGPYCSHACSRAGKCWRPHVGVLAACCG